MAHKFSGGRIRVHVHSHSDRNPIGNHICHCAACKGMTGQPTTHVAFFRHGNWLPTGPMRGRVSRSTPKNPDGPLELCASVDRGAPITPDDKQGRIRVIVRPDPARTATAPGVAQGGQSGPACTPCVPAQSCLYAPGGCKSHDSGYHTPRSAAPVAGGRIRQKEKRHEAE
jgi:hypothetical protein